MLIVKLFDPLAICRIIEQEKVSAILGVPTMLVSLLESLEQRPYDVSSVDMFSCGGSMVAPELVRNVRQVFGCDFGTLYGQTDSGAVLPNLTGVHHHPDPYSSHTTTDRRLPSLSCVMSQIREYARRQHAKICCIY